MALSKRNPLLANTGGNVTFYLYARNKPIGERISGWSYYQNDGLSVPRQMSNTDGNVTLTRTYTPWGEVFKQAGTGNFTATPPNEPFKHGGFGGLIYRLFDWKRLNEGWVYEFTTDSAYPGAPGLYRYHSVQDIYLHGATRCILSWTLSI